MASKVNELITALLTLDRNKEIRYSSVEYYYGEYQDVIPYAIVEGDTYYVIIGKEEYEDLVEHANNNVKGVTFI